MMGGHQVHWLPLAIAGLLAMLGVWLNQLTHRPVVVDNGGFEHIPDTIVEQFDALAFNRDGQPLHRLRAARLIHFLDDDTTILEAPHFSVLNATSTRTEVSAKRGQVSTNGQHVHFLDDVVVSRGGQGGQAPLTLRTEYLCITPDAGTMRSDQPVKLQQGGSVITAGNLFLSNQSKQVTLAGGVQGSYETTR